MRAATGSEFLTLRTPAFVPAKKTRDFFLASDPHKLLQPRFKPAGPAGSEPAVAMTASLSSAFLTSLPIGESDTKTLLAP